jgi:hypothetical protein
MNWIVIALIALFWIAAGVAVARIFRHAPKD